MGLGVDTMSATTGDQATEVGLVITSQIYIYIYMYIYMYIYTCVCVCAKSHAHALFHQYPPFRCHGVSETVLE